MDQETGVVTDPEFARTIGTKQADKYKQYSAQKLIIAEKNEDKRLNSPSFIDKIMDAIEKIKRKTTKKQDLEKDQIIQQNLTQNQK